MQRIAAKDLLVGRGKKVVMDNCGGVIKPPGVSIKANRLIKPSRFAQGVFRCPLFPAAAEGFVEGDEVGGHGGLGLGQFVFGLEEGALGVQDG